MTQRPAEHYVVESRGEGPRRVELTLPIEARHQVAHGTDINPPRRDLERLECEISARQTDLTLAVDLALGPPGNQRIPEGPGGLDLQGAHRPIHNGLPRQPAVKRQRIDVGARQVEGEVVRGEIALTECHDTRIRGTKRRDVPGEPAL